MELSVTALSEIISGANKDSGYNFVILPDNGVPSVFNPCLNILKKLCNTMQVIDGDVAAMLFRELPTKELDFLLSFVVFYFEVGTGLLKELLRKILVDNKELSKIKKLFSILYNTIDCYRSDIHFLAYMYLTYLGPSQYFNIIDKSVLDDSDEIKKTRIRKHVLNSSKVRTIDEHCKWVILEIGRNKSADDFLIFCYNNNKILNIFYQIDRLENIQTSEDVSKETISVKTSRCAIETFLYSQLNVFQLLACLNVNDRYFLINTMKNSANDFIINRIAELIKTHTQLTSIINSNMGLYKRSFLVYCCFLNKMMKDASWEVRIGRSYSKHENKSKMRRAIYGTVYEIINKKSANFILENCLMDDANSYYFCIIFREIIMSVFLSNKTIDDGFILELLYNGNYEKTFSSVTIPDVSRRLYLCPSKRKNTSYVWYNMSTLNNMPSCPTNVEINGIVSQNIIRPNICISHFFLKLGINKLHKPLEQKDEFGTFLQTLDKLCCKSTSNRSRINKLFSLTLV